MARNNDFPVVDVVWWDARSLHVRCPFCEEIHRHSFNSYTSGLRWSHCGWGKSYRYAFPINERTHQVAYEIDKSKARFVNVGVVMPLDADSDEENQLANDFLRKATVTSRPATDPASDTDMYKAARDKMVIKLPDSEDFEVMRIESAVSDCVTGQVNRVQAFLNTSPDASIFLRGRAHGDTTLIMASREKSHDMVALLLDRGASVDAVNHAGRSALVEAALWGRLENAKLLIGAGADRRLRDCKNHTAADLAQPTRSNQRERHLCAGGSLGPSGQEPVYKEDTLNRDADRREIVRLLTGNTTKRKIVFGDPPTASEYQNYSFRRPSMTQPIVFRGPVATYPVTTNYKTVARLERGGSFPTVAAMSGWSHSEWHSVRISGRDWTDEVMRIADVVGHTLAADTGRDRGVPGQYHACHAEKQLIAYFIDRHVFLPQDQAPDTEIKFSIERLRDELVDISYSSATVERLSQLEEDKDKWQRTLFEEDDRLRGDDYDEGKVKELKTDIHNLENEILKLEFNAEVKRARELEREIHDLEQKRALRQRVMDMSNNPPPQTLTRSLILVSSGSFDICDDCRQFNDQVNRHFELAIELVECTDRNV